MSSSVIWFCYLFVLFKFAWFNPGFIFWFLVWLKIEMYLKLHVSLSYIGPKNMKVKCITTCTHACIIIYSYTVPLIQFNFYKGIIVILYWQSPLEYLVACFNRQLSSFFIQKCGNWDQQTDSQKKKKSLLQPTIIIYFL